VTARARILLDVRAAQDDATPERGLRRWVRGLADALARRPDRCAGLLLDPRRPPPLGLSPALAASPLWAWNSATGVAAIVDEGQGPFVYVIGSPFEHQPPVGHNHVGSLVPEHVAARGLAVMAVLFDLIPLDDPSYFGSTSAVRRFAQHARTVAGLDHLLAISEHTRIDAMARLDVPPERITTIGTGVDSALLADRPDSTIAGRQWGDDGTAVVLCVAGDDERKNVPGLLRAWAGIPPAARGERRLLVVGRISAGTLDGWQRQAAGLGLTDAQVRFATDVDDDGLVAAYQRSDLVVMPSWREGFGLPVAEAVAQRRPVVTANTTASPEVLDLPESTFDPADTDDMARVITAALTDDALRGRILARADERRPTVTWDHVADRLLAAADRVVGSLGSRTGPRSATRRRVRRRVGLVGPLPPTPSGIAGHNVGLVEALADASELVLFATGAAADRSGPLLACEVHPSADLGRRIDPYSFDVLVCCLGNSAGHAQTVAVAAEVPTLLWLHEVRLPALHLAGRHGHAEVAAEMLPIVGRMYGWRTPTHAVADLGWSVQGYAEAGLGLTSELVQGARGVIVSSASALRLLAADQPPHRPLPPAFVIPLAAPVMNSGTVQRVPAGKGPAGAPTVVAAGVVAHQKQPERLIDAVGVLAGGHSGLALRFVGDVPDAYCDELRERARAAGVAERVTFTGRVATDRYRQELATATVAVQLRRSSYGESSAAILDALALGVPVLTNLASAAELPHGAVEVLPPGADAATIAARLDALLGDRSRRDRLAAAGAAYAASRHPEAVVAELMTAVETICTGAGAGAPAP